MSQPTQVFISYSHHDEGTARALTRALHKVGVEVWTPAQLPAGSDIDEGFRKKLEQADIVVLLITADSVRSPWTAFEFGASVALRKRIVPVVVGDIPLDEIPYDLKHVQMLHVDSKADVPRKVSEFLASSVAA